MSKFVLTFVHGTWGRGMIFPSGDAAWTTDESTLCRSLRDRLGPDAVFRRFRWSGRNSHTARLNASERLRDFLQGGLRDSPDATHIIVAHSHGGNVALMAVGDHPNLRERISGVVCLATPFIAAQDRNIGRDAWAILTKGTALALVFLLGQLLMESYFWFKAYDATVSIWHVVFLAVCGLVVGLVLLLRNRVRERASKLRGELSPRPLEKDKLLLFVRQPTRRRVPLPSFSFFHRPL
jgi:pimeloyl-ACP methyl ester carboxylesterase